MSYTIYLVHGMWGGPWYWENYKGFLESKGHRCLATTLRYHDADPRENPDPRLGTTSLLDYASDLEEEIKALGHKPILVGHSMGGLLAQILGSRNLAKALVLLTPASPAGINAIKPSVVKSFLSVQTKWGFWKKPMRQTFGEASYSMINLMPPGEQKNIYDRFVYESGRALFEIGYWFLDSKKASAVDEKKVTCPVLIIGGKEDRITPVSVTRSVANKYSLSATYREMENHAHWIVGEPGWEKVAQLIEDWIKKLPLDN